MEQGVPQGSILGPLLFNIIINDIFFSEKCAVLNYADDYIIYCAGSSVEEIRHVLLHEINNLTSSMQTLRRRTKLNFKPCYYRIYIYIYIYTSTSEAEPCPVINDTQVNTKVLPLRFLSVSMGLNPDYLNKMIHNKSSPYELRDTSILSRPKVIYTHYGLKTFSSYRAKM